MWKSLHRCMIRRHACEERTYFTKFRLLKIEQPTQNKKTQNVKNSNLVRGSMVTLRKTTRRRWRVAYFPRSFHIIQPAKMLATTPPRPISSGRPPTRRNPLCLLPCLPTQVLLCLCALRERPTNELSTPMRKGKNNRAFI